MGLEPYALSVSHFISSVGADAGFASIIGLAVLVLLYFAQARETASLREQAELAAQRVAQLESRIAHAASVQASQVAVAPAPGLPPTPGVIPALGFPVAPPIAAVSPAPPAGVAAPPLSAATKLIPTPPRIGIPGVAAARIDGSGRPLAAPSAAVSAGAGMGAAPASAAAAAGAAGAGPAAAGAAGAGPAAPGAGAGPAAPLLGAAAARARPASPPLMPPPASQPSGDQVVTPRPATAAGGATSTNGTGEHPVTAPPAPPIPPRRSAHIRPGGGGGGGGGGRAARPGMVSDLGGAAHSQRDLTRVLTALAAVAVVAAIVIVLLSVTGGGTAARSNSSASTPVSNTPTTHHHASAPRTPAVNPASVTVAVLNGTAVYHLANGIGQQLGAAGYKEGTITNASTQTQPNTTVEYGPGYQRDAAAIAKVLKLSSSSVQPLTTATQQTLGCPQTASCTVVVTVGQDLVPSTQTTTTG